MPLQNSDQMLVPDPMERIIGQRRLLDPRMESETCKVRPCCLQKTLSHCLPLLTSHHLYSAMSIDASSISTVSSLPTVSQLSSRNSSSTPTRSDAGWGLSRSDGRGSPNVHHVPTSPPALMEPPLHSSVIPPPVLSVDIPLATHCLCEGTLDGHCCDILHSYLYVPHLHRTFEFHLEPNSPLWSVTCIYFQNQCLKTILDLASSLSSIGRRCNTLHTIQREVEEDLFSTFYQMQMSKFANDLEQYVKELTASTNLQPLLSASSSPLSSEVELTLQCAELRHEVDTTGTIHGIPVDAPFFHNHPHYHESCFECHYLGHICIHCQWYSMSVQYAKSTAPAILNNIALWVVQSLTLPHLHLHPPPNLILFLPHVPDGWSLRTPTSVVTTLVLIPPLVLVPL